MIAPVIERRQNMFVSFEVNLEWATISQQMLAIWARASVTLSRGTSVAAEARKAAVVSERVFIIGVGKAKNKLM